MEADDEVPVVINDTQDVLFKRSKNQLPTKRCIFVALVVFYSVYIVIYDPFYKDIYKSEGKEETLVKENTNPWQWQGCPKMDQMLITSLVDGRLGNLVWEYLSVWAVARRYNMWPVMTRSSINELNKVFRNLSVPVVEDIAADCEEFANLSNILANEPRHAPSFKSLLQIIEEQPAQEGNKIVVVTLPYYVVLTQEVVSYWKELAVEMQLRTSLQDEAQNILHAIVNQTNAGNNVSQKIEFVGVHVRRTDYMNHIRVVYGKAAQIADERFFKKAMEYLKSRIKNTTLLFMVLSDDTAWCKEKLAAPDVFLSGTGNASSPGLDLAILGACNHTIFAYGTFALTGAMLAQGRYTILFDTQNNTNSKEMEFAPYLPGWHIINENGVQPDMHDKPYRLTFVHG